MYSNSVHSFSTLRVKYFVTVATHGVVRHLLKPVLKGSKNGPRQYPLTIKYPLCFLSVATQFFEKYTNLCQEESRKQLKRARLTCNSNRRLTFSSILSIAIAIAIAIAVAARYDTIYFTLYPMYSGVAPNCYGLAHSACSIAHTYERQK